MNVCMDDVAPMNEAWSASERFIGTSVFGVMRQEPQPRTITGNSHHGKACTTYKHSSSHLVPFTTLVKRRGQGKPRRRKPLAILRLCSASRYSVEGIAKSRSSATVARKFGSTVIRESFSNGVYCSPPPSPSRLYAQRGKNFLFPPCSNVCDRFTCQLVFSCLVFCIQPKQREWEGTKKNQQQGRKKLFLLETYQKCPFFACVFVFLMMKKIYGENEWTLW